MADSGTSTISPKQPVVLPIGAPRPGIVVDAVSYAYPDRRSPVPAVDAVSLDLARGQLGVLVGLVRRRRVAVAERAVGALHVDEPRGELGRERQVAQALEPGLRLPPVIRIGLFLEQSP